jgi:hypothetical protein
MKDDGIKAKPYNGARISPRTREQLAKDNQSLGLEYKKLPGGPERARVGHRISINKGKIEHFEKTKKDYDDAGTRKLRAVGESDQAAHARESIPHTSTRPLRGQARLDAIEKRMKPYKIATPEEDRNLLAAYHEQRLASLEANVAIIEALLAQR